MNKATKKRTGPAYARHCYAQFDRHQIVTHYEAQIDEALGDVIARLNTSLPDVERVRYDTSLKYRGPLGDGSNLMFGLCLSFVGCITMANLIDIAEALTVFETDEQEPWEHHGMHLTLGDGDDQLAVQFREGCIEIWLRAWHPSHIGGVLMVDMRDGFRDIVSGHSLIDDFASLTDVIEESAKWVKDNGGLDACTADERATITYLLERQMALAEREGHGIFTRPD